LGELDINFEEIPEEELNKIHDWNSLAIPDEDVSDVDLEELRLIYQES
jgi:hypothetical protein